MKQSTDLTHFQNIARLFHGEKWESMKIQEKCAYWIMLLTKKDIRGAMIRTYLTSRKEDYLREVYNLSPNLSATITEIKSICENMPEQVVIAPFQLTDIYITIVNDPSGGQLTIASEHKPHPENLMESSDITKMPGYIGQVSTLTDPSKVGMNMKIETNNGIVDAFYQFPHKAVYINNNYRKKGLGILLYHIHDEIFGEYKREMCKSPALAKLYISMGFIPTGVYKNGIDLPDPRNPSSRYTDAITPQIFKRSNPNPTWVQFYRPDDN